MGIFGEILGAINEAWSGGKSKNISHKALEDAVHKIYEDEVNEYIGKLAKDLEKFPYSDKVEAKNGDIHYTFETGEIFAIVKGKIKYTYFSKTKQKTQTATYNLRVSYVNQIIGVFNDLIGAINNNPQKFIRPDNVEPLNKKKPQTSTAEKLKVTIEQRKKNLEGMSEEDPDRNALENELKVAEAKFKKMNNN